MEKSLKLPDVLAVLARNNINVLEVIYAPDGETSSPYAVAFEYQWRVTPTSTKWTRAVQPWSENYGEGVSAAYARNLALVLKTVRELRSQLEG